MRRRTASDRLKAHFKLNNCEPTAVDALFYGYCNNLANAQLAHAWLQSHQQKLNQEAKTEAGRADITWLQKINAQVNKILTHPNFQQAHITKKLRAVYQKHFPDDYHAMEDLHTVGACNGFAILVACVKTGVLPGSQTKGSDIIDWTKLKELFEFFSSWDETSSLTDSRLKDAIFLVSALNSIHSIRDYTTHEQGDCEGFVRFRTESSGTVTYRRPRLHYAIGAPFTQNEAKKTLDHLVPSKTTGSKFTLVRSHNHDMSIIHVSSTIEFYDSNNITGPIVVDSTAVLAFLSFFANDFYDEAVPSTLGFCVHGYTDNEQKFPPHEKILENLTVVKRDDLDQEHNSTHTAIDIANRVGSVECIRFFFQKGAMRYDSKLQFYRLATIKELFEHDPSLLRQKNRDDGDYPIHAVIKRYQLDLLKFILEKHKSTLDIKDNNGFTPVQLAIEIGYVAAIRLLVRYDANLMLKNPSGKTAVQAAEEKGDFIYLPNLQIGSDFLIRAARANNLQQVRLLLLTGVNPNTKSAYGRFPIDISHDQEVRMTLSRAMRMRQSSTLLFSWLYIFGLDVVRNPLPNDDRLILIAARTGHKYVEEVLKFGVDLTVCDKDGKTALHLASELGHIESAKKLIDAGADLYSRVDDSGRSALASAKNNETRIALIHHHNQLYQKVTAEQAPASSVDQFKPVIFHYVKKEHKTPEAPPKLVVSSVTQFKPIKFHVVNKEQEVKTVPTLRPQGK